MIPMRSRLLRLNISLALAVATALLLLRLLTFLISLSSLLNPALIFVLSHLLILAIVLCSASSSSSRPSPQNEPFETHSNTPSDSRDSPPYSLPSPDPGLALLPEEDLLSSVPQQKKKEPAVLVVSDDQFEPAPIVPESSFVPVSSQRTIMKSPTQLVQNFGIPIISDPQMINQLELPKVLARSNRRSSCKSRSLHNRENFAIASSAADDRMVRSKSDSKILCTGATAKSCTKTITRRIEFMDSAPVDIRTECDSESSSTIVIRLASFESLVEDDLCERCDKFIANIYENWKQESVEGNN